MKFEFIEAEKFNEIRSNFKGIKIYTKTNNGDIFIFNKDNKKIIGCLKDGKFIENYFQFYKSVLRDIKYECDYWNLIDFVWNTQDALFRENGLFYNGKFIGELNDNSQADSLHKKLANYIIEEEKSKEKYLNSDFSNTLGNLGLKNLFSNLND